MAIKGYGAKHTKWQLRLLRDMIAGNASQTTHVLVLCCTTQIIAHTISIPVRFLLHDAH